MADTLVLDVGGQGEGMSVGRRSFLALLGMAGASAMLPGSSLVIPEVGSPVTVLGGRSMILTQQWLAVEVAREMREALGDWRLTYVPSKDGAKLGDHAEGVVLNKRHYVGTDWQNLGPSLPIGSAVDFDTFDRIRELWARPVGKLLADGVRSAGIRTLSDLPMPRGGARVTRIGSKDYGIGLRLVEQYDINLDQTHMRVDLIGSSEV